MATRKKSKKKLTKREKHRIIVILTVVLCFFSGVLSYYLVDKFFFSKTQIGHKNEPLQPKKDDNKALKNITKTADKNITKKVENDIKNKPKIVDLNRSDDNKSTQNSSILMIEKDKDDDKIAPKIKPTSKPKLAIIIDDISTNSQIQSIKSLNLKITPSIFPPNKKFPNTPNLAKNLNHFSIHLPLEALNYSDNLITLSTTHSYNEIDWQIANLRKNFPNAKFINNHTGSKFTSDRYAMNNLLRALRKHGFYFVDSRTFRDTKTQILAPKYGLKYIYRDVFLDNVDSVASVRKELQKAVEIANTKGYAIAIAHPKSTTFRALATSGDILNQVELVYLDEIYEFYE